MTNGPVDFFFLGGNLFGYSVTKYGLRELFESQLHKTGQIAFDTAEAYGTGMSESMIGAALANLKVPRNKIVALSKFSLKSGSHRDLAEQLKLKVGQSLQRLGIDHLDMAFLHNPEVHIPPEEAAHAFQELKRSGLALDVGLSNPAGLAWSQLFSKIAGNNSQEFFTPLKPRGQCEGTFSPKAVYGIFARGLLFEKQPDELNSRLLLNPKLKTMYFDSRMIDLRQKLARRSQEYGLSSPQLLLAATWGHGHTPIIGVRTIKALEELLAVDPSVLPVQHLCAELENLLTSEIPEHFLGAPFPEV